MISFSFRILGFLLTSFVTIAAQGAAYYVDQQKGSDSWSGRHAAPIESPGADGPWQSLEKVSNATLLPGDVVYLACSQTWRETLRVAQDGQVGAPITVDSYPNTCTNSPAIDGSIGVPANAWRIFAGKIFVANLPVNVLGPGIFSTDKENWRVWSQNSDATIAFSNSCESGPTGCLAVTAGNGTGPSLAISPGWNLQAIDYALSFSINAPAGVTVKAIVRRDVAPWDTLGFAEVIVGNGSWRGHTFSFRGRGDLVGARLDFEIPPGKSLKLDGIKLLATPPHMQTVQVDGQPINTAHHPNKGSSSADINSPYALLAQDSDTVVIDGKPVSTFVTVGQGLNLPTGASLTSGLGIRLRTNAWKMDERKVASVNVNRLSLDLPSSFPLRAGWGYLLTGARWMLDSPGEWFYDANSKALYVWMPDGQSPGNRVSIGNLDVGANLSGRQHVVLDGIAIRNTSTAFDVAQSNTVTVRNGRVNNSVDQGFLAINSRELTIERMVISNVGREAILGVDYDYGSVATNMRVINNIISNSGVRFSAGEITSIPSGSNAAVRPGSAATVSGNSIVNTNYIGIWPLANSTVANNYVSNTCLVLDDCAAIYVNRSPNNTRITGNLINGVAGAIHGKPSRFSQGQGIYLDDHASGVVVQGNTVSKADHGLQLHNANSNQILGNKFFGNRRHQIWVQENSNDVRTTGDVFANRFESNIVVPLDTSPAVNQETDYSSTSSLSSYQFNRYSGLLSPVMAIESWVNGVQSYNFPQWKSAKNANNVSRNLDTSGAQTTLGTFAAFKVNGPNLVQNGSLSNGLASWSAWNQTAPFGTMTLDNCAGFNCVKYQAGASTGLLYSAGFSVQQGKRYRLSFDMKTGVNGQSIVVGVRRGGGGSNGFEWLMPNPSTFSGLTSWQRFSTSFEATKTVNAKDPLTLDSGARVDFQVSGQGKVAWVRNVQLVPLASVGASLKKNIVVNPSIGTTAAVHCPDVGAEAAFCNSYVRFTDGGSISWPYTLGPLQSEIIYSRGDTMVDGDADGIGDIQDACSNTTPNATVNAQGCSLAQAP